MVCHCWSMKAGYNFMSKVASFFDPRHRRISTMESLGPKLSNVWMWWGSHLPGLFIPSTISWLTYPTGTGPVGLFLHLRHKIEQHPASWSWLNSTSIPSPEGMFWRGVFRSRRHQHEVGWRKMVLIKARWNRVSLFRKLDDIWNNLLLPSKNNWKRRLNHDDI